MLEVELRNLTVEELIRRFINSEDPVVRLLAEALEANYNADGYEE